MGELIGDRYEVEKLVGRGGNSSVFKAHDLLLERNVALKILHEHHLDDEEYVERFKREARTVAQLSHPNIVTVIDRGETDGRPFIVFEYVDGQTLDQVIHRRGAMPIDEALEIAIASARGLAFAHRHGLVHRDVKPQNILLNGDRQPKVTDFGIARSLDVKKGVTQTGTVLGTSNYIAPEQASGDPAGAASDVYSLGVVLFELLTGRVPFEGENFVTVAMKHINEPAPSVTALRPDVPPRVAAAVSRALAKDPRNRFASMDEFAAELEACLAELRVGGADSTRTVMNAPVPDAARRRNVRARRRVTPGPLFVSLLALAALAVIVVAAIAVQRDTGLPGISSAQGGGRGHAVSLSAVATYDPEGGGGEHDSEIGNATDRNVSTYWTTEHYNGSDFGGLKVGVGLVLSARGSDKLEKLTVTSDTPGFTAVVKVGSSAEAAQTDSAEQTVNGKTTFDLMGLSGPFYVLWITNLDGDGVAHVNEVTATS
jgi:tRNA A-37 threonylcarbamoyl transferase component Bud32